MSNKLPQMSYEESYKQARLFCMKRNGTTHNYRYPHPSEFYQILAVLRSFNKQVKIEIAICNDCRHIKFINYELPDIGKQELSII